MNESITFIPFTGLFIIFIPVAAVIGILHQWSLDWKNTIYAVSRMLVQLLMIGYCLSYIFLSNNAAFIILVLSVMVLAASWISLRTIAVDRLESVSYTHLTLPTICCV